MYYLFSKSHVGYSHLKNHVPSQDYSASYQDPERLIITCADGHGGKQYVRSNVGSKLASEAVMNVFKSIDKNFFYRKNDVDLIENLKLLVLLEYNKLVERDYGKRPISKRELANLDEDEIDALKNNPAKAYGTTLTGAMIYKDRIIVIAIGDTEALGVKKGELIKIFDNEDDPAGNVTYSMCQEDAYKYLRVAILPEGSLDMILLCTDGMSSPYQSYKNFLDSFIRPSVTKVIESKSTWMISDHVTELASELGTGDDVSLAFLLSDKTKTKFYK